MQTQLSFQPSTKQAPVTTLDPLDDLHEQFVAVDIESDGLGPGSLPVGIVVSDSQKDRYLPFRHPDGRQHTAENVRRWTIDQLAGRDLIFREAKQDMEWLRRWGVDVEKLGCRPHEVQHAAGLLNDHRRVFTLDALAQDRLGVGKVEVPTHKISELSADVAAVYARRDGRLTYDLHFSYEKDIRKEGLEKVLELEDDLIYCTAHMQRQGVHLNLEKLDRWIDEVTQAHQDRVIELHRLTGLRINPDSSPDMVKLFLYLGKSFGHTLKGMPSFTDEFLKDHLDVPEIKLAAEIRDLASLLSKYLLKYRRDLRPDGLLPYLLHQMRNDEFGTITGRYAASKVNIQQVFKPDKQEWLSPVTIQWIIRELFEPPPGRLWFHCDASQIEFRLFAHYSCVPCTQPWCHFAKCKHPRSTRLIDAYRNNPDVDFHDFVTHDVLKDIMPRSLAKNFNFMKLYGGGIGKAMRMMKTDDEEKAQAAVNKYDEAFSESGRLLQFCSWVAEHRGFVRTFLGRKRRYYPGERFYSGLNSVLQGGAADLMKLKLLRVYRELKRELNLRFTVHDELNGDVDGSEKDLKRIRECLDVQEFPLRVFIKWESSVGLNWKHAMANEAKSDPLPPETPDEPRPDGRGIPDEAKVYERITHDPDRRK